MKTCLIFESENVEEAEADAVGVADGGRNGVADAVAIGVGLAVVAPPGGVVALPAGGVVLTGFGTGPEPTDVDPPLQAASERANGSAARAMRARRNSMTPASSHVADGAVD